MNYIKHKSEESLEDIWKQFWFSVTENLRFVL